MHELKQTCFSNGLNCFNIDLFSMVNSANNVLFETKIKGVYCVQCHSWYWYLLPVW